MLLKINFLMTWEVFYVCFFISGWILLIVRMRQGSFNSTSGFPFWWICMQRKCVHKKYDGNRKSSVIPMTCSSSNSFPVMYQNHMVIWHQKLFLMIYQLVIQWGPPSVKLTTKNGESTNWENVSLIIVLIHSFSLSRKYIKKALL